MPEQITEERVREIVREELELRSFLDGKKILQTLKNEVNKGNRIKGIKK